MKHYLSLLKTVLLIALNVISKINSKFLEAEPHIIGGTGTSISSAPYTVSLQCNGQHFCGGSLITPCFVITAAHCMVYDPAKLIVQLNSTKLYTGGIKVKVLTTMKHPKYNNNTFAYDFGMIKLAQPVSNITFAQLPREANGQPGPNGTRLRIFGWGTLQESGTTASDYLQTVDIPLIDFQTCNKTLSSMNFPYLNDQCEFCAGESGKDSCKGDSGGPCIRISDKVLVGSVSFGIGCGGPNGGVYAKIVYALDWINSIIAANPCPPQAKSSNKKKIRLLGN